MSERRLPTTGTPPAMRPDAGLSILERALAEADARPRPGYQLTYLGHLGTHFREPRLLAWMEAHLDDDTLVLTEGAPYGPIAPRAPLSAKLAELREVFDFASVMGGAFAGIAASMRPESKSASGAVPGSAAFSAESIAQIWNGSGGRPLLTTGDVSRLMDVFAGLGKGQPLDPLLDDAGFIRALVKDIQDCGIDWMEVVNKPHELGPALGFAVSAAEGLALLRPGVRLYGIEDRRHYEHNLEIARKGGTSEDFERVASLRSRVLFENCIRAMDELGTTRACAYLTGFHRFHFLDEAPRRKVQMRSIYVIDREFDD